MDNLPSIREVSPPKESKGMTLVEMFTKVPGPNTSPIPGVHLDRTNSGFSRATREKLYLKAPYFDSKGNRSKITEEGDAQFLQNPDLVKNQRYQQALSMTGSQVYAAAAAFGQNIQEQAEIYRRVAFEIVQTHYENGFLSPWIEIQHDAKLVTGLTVLQKMEAFDYDKNGRLKPENERMLGYDRNGEFSHMNYPNVWRHRIKVLKAILNSENPILQYYMPFWIEYLAAMLKTGVIFARFVKMPEAPLQSNLDAA